MKFVCLGYMDESKWDAMTEDERKSMMEECFAFDDELRKGGHILGGEALQGIQNGATIRVRGEEVVVTDGPFAETKEHLGGFMIFEARDLNHAIQLMSRHPGVRFGPFEIRPIDEKVREFAEARQAAHRA